MKIQLHKNARTTPAVRREMQAFTGTTRDLAKKFNVSYLTAKKWRNRTDVHDASHCPHRVKATLNEAQEILVVELRRLLRIGLDDLLAVVREFIHPEMSRSALDRMLRRRGVPSLQQVAAAEAAAGETVPKKTFKDYEPGFIHIDIKYLPKINGEERQYLFVAIDRATRWVFHAVYPNQEVASSRDFLERLTQAAPMKIRTILTDNGTQFTDRFTAKDKAPSGEHVFDKTCQQQGIEHRLIPPRHPQTNGMVERFNGRISEVLQTHHFDSNESLEATLQRFVWMYNHHLPQRNIGHISPIDALKQWQDTKPDLFTKQVRKYNNQPGLDN